MPTHAISIHQDGQIPDEEIEAVVDLRMHMDVSPYTIHEVSLNRKFDWVEVCFLLGVIFEVLW